MRDTKDSDSSAGTEPDVPALADALTQPAGGPRAAVALGRAGLLDGVDFPRRYRDETRLGLGGMGEVRLCTDQLIGREVALKVIHGDGGTHPERVQRFLREARVQARLEHPAVVPIHDVGRTDDGRVYFTMKRVRGRTLADILDGLARGDAELASAFSRRKLLTAFVSVCQAVELAHRHGVLHRDIKPSNVMLGDLGEVYVLDWGVARIDGAADTSGPATAVAPADDVAPTVAGAIIGTAGYMSPEQARGEHAALDARTDVYALGAVLFEILALEPLHSRRGGTVALASTLMGTDASPGRRAPSRDVPPELDDLCVRATALDRADRPASVRALAHEIERFLDGDRDLELRRRLAERHATDAADMTDVALASDDERGRSRAMQEVGRALALDPENTVARSAMLRLMTTPPRKMPDEARANLDASALESQRFGAKMGVFSYLLWFTAVPIGLWMGVVDRTLFAFFVVAHVLALLGCATQLRATRAGGPTTLAAFAGVWLASLSLVLVFGSLVLVPTIVAATMTWILLHPRPRSRVAIATAFLAIIVVPIALELAGVIAPSYRFTDTVLSLAPRMVLHREAPTLLALVFGSVATIATLAVAIARMRTMLSAAEERLELHAWQLRQMVPVAADRLAPAARHVSSKG